MSLYNTELLLINFQQCIEEQVQPIFANQSSAVNEHSKISYPIKSTGA